MKDDENLVLYHYEGINDSIDGIKVTLKSLKEYYNGKIVVLYKNVSNKLINFLSDQKVELVDCSNYKIIYQTSPYNNKIICSFLYLRDNKEILQNYNILISDISDFYFKDNPFSLQQKELVLSLEDKEIKNCEVNTTWADICYGKDVRSKMQNNIVINGGFVLGTYSQVYSLYDSVLKDMANILSRVNYPITDQIIINKLVYLDNIPCSLDSKNINHLSQGIKTNIENKINHQYKVNPTYTKKLYSLYE
jgi:hypothetical protein